MITQKTIAEKLGMPASTVANILNGTPNYKQETRERVFKMVEELGYQPGRASQILRRGRSNLIGIIHFGSPYGTAHLGIKHAVKAITEAGYDSLVVDSHWHEGNNDRMLGEIIQSRVEGVLLIANTDSPTEQILIDRLKRAGIPIVSALGEDYWDIPRVAGNARDGFYSMLRHLQQVGHRHILFAAPPFAVRSTAGRIEGFQKAMEGWGECLTFSEAEFFEELPRLRQERRKETVGIIVRMEMTSFHTDILQENYLFANKLFDLKYFPDAIMCMNDRAAYGVFNAAYERKIKIPGKLAVTGSDDESVGTFPMFRLTSIRYDVASSAVAAVKMLMKLVKKQPLRKKEVSFPGELILRQSCGRREDSGAAEVVIPFESAAAKAKPRKTKAAANV